MFKLIFGTGSTPIQQNKKVDSPKETKLNDDKEEDRKLSEIFRATVNDTAVTINLIHAVDRGDVKKVREFVGNPEVDVNPRLTGVEFLLHRAARLKTTEILKILLGAKANTECRDNSGRTPLLVAVREGSLENVRALITAGANVNAFDINGNTSLHSAGLTVSKAQELIAAGAKVNLLNRTENTPLMIAREEEREEIISALIDAGATE
ncbi:MAG: ankyrin repeat domain-containing protein [Bdellovibrionota bacterium]